MILKGYVDDSADDAAYVLAGYVAPANEWAKFSDEWQEVLDAKPRISVLKARDAMGLNGEFNGWREEARDDKLRAFYEVIRAHVSFEVFAIIPMQAFHRVFDGAPIPKRSKRPFIHAFAGLIGMLAKAQTQQGMRERVDFIFDDDINKAGVIAAYDAIVRDAPPDIKPMLGATPVFADDEKILPLQAADLEAWWLRRRVREKELGLAELEYPWQPDSIPGAGSIHTEETLRQAREKLERSYAMIGYDHATGKVDAAAQAALGIEPDEET